MRVFMLIYAFSAQVIAHKSTVILLVSYRHPFIRLRLKKRFREKG